MELKVKTVFIAPRLKRLVAYLLDFLPILFIVYYIFINYTGYSVLFDDYLKEAEGGTVDFEKLSPAFIQYTNYINTIAIVVMGLYGAVAESSSWRATLGKRLMKIKVGDSVGKAIDGGVAFKRNVLKILVLNIVPLLGIWVLFDPKNRGLYDIFSKTLVVSDKDYSHR